MNYEPFKAVKGTTITKPSKTMIAGTMLLLFALIILCIAAFLYTRGYKNATIEYQNIIKELEAEVDRLSQPVAVYEEATAEVDISLIKSEIENIGELATVEYLYTDAGKFEDPAELFGHDLPFSFTTKHFIAKWDGVIKAGINLSDVTVEVNKFAKEITIHLPDAKILSHEIDQDSIETLDQKNGLFNPIEIEDVRTFDAVSKEAMEARVIENGLLDKAFENAKNIIQKLILTEKLKDMGYSIIILKAT
jgi:hypothetical protein